MEVAVGDRVLAARHLQPLPYFFLGRISQSVSPSRLDWHCIPRLLCTSGQRSALAAYLDPHTISVDSAIRSFLPESRITFGVRICAVAAAPVSHLHGSSANFQLLCVSGPPPWGAVIYLGCFNPAAWALRHPRLRFLPQCRQELRLRPLELK